MINGYEGRHSEIKCKNDCSAHNLWNLPPGPLKKYSNTYSRNPECGKPLRNVPKGYRRVHIGSFVLIYEVDDTDNTITLLSFIHHDKAYK
ncbi:MAG: type II toxin-antitoxin system RelE/ParE family toxin [Methanolobus sp.]|nr:type II toxin-antitoxin system RelE/ParE family toxin [Methanolobus sp.]